MSVTIISGAPGVGKSTLARRLAADHSRGVHLATDEFFRFLTHRVDPSLPEAHAQNLTIVRAYASAAREYADGDYQVYMDGVIGPWMLPVILSVLEPFEYVLLHAPLEVACARARQREAQASATAAVIRTMHAQFTASVGEIRQHVIQTGGRSQEAITEEYRLGHDAGRFLWQPGTPRGGNVG